MAKRKFDPVHPGVVLAKDFLNGLQVSQYRLAKGIGVSPRRINEIVQGKRGITADTALRLGKFFSIEAQFWMNLQSHYDLEVAKDALAGRLAHEVDVHNADGRLIPSAAFRAIGKVEVRRMREFLARQRVTAPVARDMRRSARY